ncbi:hypothetical protein [Pseudomonas silesiensis]|uniref:hypothetical protein n=1 Tax=Pseudomonas silesiensis TaxID=1853130 RepID=UPI0030D79D12
MPGKPAASVLCVNAQGPGLRHFRRGLKTQEVNVSNDALKETVIAQSQIITALIAAIRKKDALDLALFTDLLEQMQEKNKEDETGKNKIYNRMIETAKSACLIRDQQPTVDR